MAARPCGGGGYAGGDSGSRPPSGARSRAVRSGPATAARSGRHRTQLGAKRRPAGRKLMTPPFPQHTARRFDIRDFGARGDGRMLATDAINAAIVVAAQGGGGLVVIPAGRFLCFTIRLTSHVTILFEEGAAIEAADPARHGGAYDLPEP